jgi:hypothetical protein
MAASRQSSVRARMIALDDKDWHPTPDQVHAVAMMRDAGLEYAHNMVRAAEQCGVYDVGRLIAALDSLFQTMNTAEQSIRLGEKKN